MTKESTTHSQTSSVELGLESEVDLSMRMYFSTYYLWAAEHFSKKAGEIEDSHVGKPKFDLEHRSYIVNSVFSTVAFLEAVINEFFQDVYDGDLDSVLDQRLIDKLATVWKITGQKNKNLSIVEKFEIVIDLADVEEFDKSVNPYQDVILVINLRNRLTHYKPMDLGEKNKHPLDDTLRPKFNENKMMVGSGNNFFPDKAMGVGCTEWCLNSVKNFADEFFKRIDVQPNYQKVDMDKLAGKT